MKKIILPFLIGIFSMAMVSCEYDNYEKPNVRLYGNIVYQGEPINVKYNDVNLQLWESGWDLNYRIDVTVSPEGAYSALVFDGDYKLIIPSHQGPFRSIENTETQSDTILVSLNGDYHMDIEVEPYYMVRNTQFSVSGNTLSTNFGLEKIIKDIDAKDIETVYLYVNKTKFVDFDARVADAALAAGDIVDMNSISLSLTIPELVPTQNYVFARVGVKIAGVEDLLFSAVEKVNL